MNVRNLKIILAMMVVLQSVKFAAAKSAMVSVSEANKLYAQGEYDGAVEGYEEALAMAPGAFEPRFNKANSFYKMDKVAEALELYKEVAAESRDEGLVGRAKYNLGNSYFKAGMGQKEKDPEKAIEDLKTAVSYWRGVLDMAADNPKAAKNIEVAKRLIKQMAEEQKKQKQQQQKQDPNQPQDPNQAKQSDSKDSKQKQQQKQGQQEKQEQQKGSEDPNQADKQKKQQGKKEREGEKEGGKIAAQEILNREKEQKKQRQILQRAGFKKVEKDW